MSVEGRSGKAISRADLLRSLLLAGETSLSASAELTGFEAPEKRPLKLKMPVIDLPRSPKKTKEDQPQFKETLPEVKQTTYYRVIGREESEQAPPISSEPTEKPQWYLDTPRLDPDSVRPLAVKAPTKQPLVLWEKLWPVLKETLCESKQTRQADIPRLVSTLANGEMFTKILRKARQQWTASLQILVDRTERTRLFNQDYTQLIEQLSKLRGVNGVSVQQVMREAGGRVRIKQGKKTEVKDWHVPTATTTVLVLSDLGLLDESGLGLKAWRKLGKDLQRSGIRVVVLIPLPERYLLPDLIRLFECVCLHRRCSLPTVRSVYPRSETDQSPLVQDAMTSAKVLLAWLSPAMRVEAGLLRAIRHQLPIQTYDVGSEVAAWHHEDVVPSPIGFHFQPSAIEEYRQRFEQQARENPLLAKKIIRIIRDYHRHVFPSQRYEELLILDGLMKGDLEPQDKTEVADAQVHLRQLFKASIEQRDEISGLAGYIPHYSDRQHRDMLAYSGNEFLQAINIMRQLLQAGTNEIRVPDGWDLSTVLAFINQQPVTSRNIVVFQRENDALEVASQVRYEAGRNGFKEGIPLLDFKIHSEYLFHRSVNSAGKTERVLLSLKDDKTQTLPLSDEEVQEIHFSGQAITLEKFQKPEWAIGTGCDAKGLYAESQNQEGDIYRWYWNLPETRNQISEGKHSEDQTEGVKIYRGFWFSDIVKVPTLLGNIYWGEHGRLANAEITQRDEFGLKALLTLNGIDQWFRWIEPTTFQMGSPETEKGRFHNEAQHQVTLTQGYWLSEATCTQALWQAVMNDNPSHFKGKNKPVESISWNDIQTFLSRINEQTPELDLKLPSEAEWENACRASSTSAFNFGDEIPESAMNYRDSWDDYNKWGEEARQQTTDVKSYPANDWGLYEMHGNILEWCEDCYETLSNELTTDPKGPKEGKIRVLRGGSWLNVGQRCRSAYRSYDDPSRSGSFIGFRLSHGHDNPPARAAFRADQQSSGTRTLAGGGTLMSAIFKHRTHIIYPETFPEPWASGWGDDEFGLWMSFTYKDVVQVFRWCEPGEFLMGSPEDEPQRGRDETQHRVELTKGFWIAETTVTQALWQAVMGGNPSIFNGDNNPVDSVSWDDAQIFIEKMNTRKPELKLCLPSEAQWEYACRAETETPSYFGNNIDSNIVNFDGNVPYGNAEKSEYKAQTVAVKSLPPNDWGLYEMHGNLWEWCQDWHGDYLNSPTLKTVTSNPLGLETGKGRVLRGGSWIGSGQLCRSACRRNVDPSWGGSDFGFRLSRGH